MNKFDVDYDTVFDALPVPENRRGKKRDRRERLTQQNIVARKNNRSERRMKRYSEDDYDR